MNGSNGGYVILYVYIVVHETHRAITNASWCSKTVFKYFAGIVLKFISPKELKVLFQKIVKLNKLTGFRFLWNSDEPYQNQNQNPP